MFLLDNNGKIIGFNDEEENLPPPFPIEGTKWDGEKWIYPEIDKNLIKETEIPPLINTIKINAFDLLQKIQSVIRPSGGSLIKEKSDKISVLIPSYKKEKWIKEAIQSALNNTMKPFEVMVLAMTDEDYNSASEITDPLVKVIKHSQLNASAARNKLVTLCNTEYFIFLDADDLLANNFIETVYNCEASIVGVPVKDEYKWYDLCNSERYFAAYTNLTLLLHKEVWNEVGGLREDLATGGEDCFFINEIFRQKKWLVDFNPNSYYEYRKVDENSLYQKNDTKNFVLSTERELYLHKDWYKKCLSETPLVLEHIPDTFNDFLEKYKDGNNTGVPIDIEIKNPLGNNSAKIAIAERWNNARHLFEESRMRDTNYVCKDKTHPFLYGRKFDVYVFSPPTLNWNFSKDKNAFYVNNPNVDLSLPTEEILKNYSVHFSETQNFITYIDNTISTKDRTKELENKAKEILKNIHRTVNDLHENCYTISFFTNCNLNCPYCIQEDLNKVGNIDEDEIYKRFLIAVDKIESFHGVRWVPILSGGEITLCSDELIKKIMKRFENYQKVEIMTNGNKYKESLFYRYPNVSALVHLVGKPYDDSFLRPYDNACVVITKQEMPSIIEAIKNKKLKETAHTPIYFGKRDYYRLSNSELQEITKVINENYRRKKFCQLEFINNPEVCIRLNYISVRQINLWDMTIAPCCGYSEPFMPLKDWNLQMPSGKVCSTCYKFTYS